MRCNPHFKETAGVKELLSVTERRKEDIYEVTSDSITLTPNQDDIILTYNKMCIIIKTHMQ